MSEKEVRRRREGERNKREIRKKNDEMTLDPEPEEGGGGSRTPTKAGGREVHGQVDVLARAMKDS